MTNGTIGEPNTVTQTAEKKKTTLGLEENIEGALCYVLGFITGIVFLVLEKDNKFVRFHAMQSIVTFLPLWIIGLIFSWMWLFGLWILSTLIWLLSLILWLILMLKAFQGEKYKLPIVGDIAEQQTK